MDRMKTFLIYFLLLFGFFFLSFVLENALVSNMYAKISGEIGQGSYGDDISISNVEADASSVNGNLKYTIKNNTDQDIESSYSKIELMDEYGNVVATEYAEISDLKAGEERDAQVKFKGHNIKDYKITMIDENEVPDRSNIFRIFGWEFDLSNVFGMDLTNVSFMGVKLKNLINWAKVKSTGKSLWAGFITTAKGVPWWAYVAAAGIVIWHLPAGYLFFL